MDDICAQSLGSELADIKARLAKLENEQDLQVWGCFVLVVFFLCVYVTFIFFWDAYYHTNDFKQLRPPRVETENQK